MPVFVHAAYASDEQAQVALQALLEAHVRPRDVHMVMHDGANIERVPVRYRTSTRKSAAIFGAIGAAMGAIVGASGLLSLLSSRVTLGAFEGLLAGAGLGVFLGFVRGVGWWRQEAQLPHHVPVRGAVLVGVSISPKRVKVVRPILEKTGGTEIEVSDHSTVERARQEVLQHQHQH